MEEREGHPEDQGERGAAPMELEEAALEEAAAPQPEGAPREREGIFFDRRNVPVARIVPFHYRPPPRDPAAQPQEGHPHQVVNIAPTVPRGQEIRVQVGRRQPPDPQPRIRVVPPPNVNQNMPFRSRILGRLYPDETLRNFIANRPPATTIGTVEGVNRPLTLNIAHLQRLLGIHQIGRITEELMDVILQQLLIISGRNERDIMIASSHLFQNGQVPQAGSGFLQTFTTRLRALVRLPELILLPIHITTDPNRWILMAISIDQRSISLYDGMNQHGELELTEELMAYANFMNEFFVNEQIPILTPFQPFRIVRVAYPHPQLDMDLSGSFLLSMGQRLMSNDPAHDRSQLQINAWRVELARILIGTSDPI